MIAKRNALAVNLTVREVAEITGSLLDIYTHARHGMTESERLAFLDIIEELQNKADEALGRKTLAHDGTN